MKLMDIYHTLYHYYSPEEWWPINHSFKPKEFEIILGAILTQNTNWRNVEKALKGLENAGLISPNTISNADEKLIEKHIKPSGFFRQKTKRLKSFSKFILSFDSFEKFSDKVTRDELLSKKGIGPETADSILLYALGKRSFVIDAYTKRIFTRLGFRDLKTYEEWRKFFENNVTNDVDLYKQYHALIVEHAKAFCRTKPLCKKCPLNEMCEKKI